MGGHEEMELSTIVEIRAAAPPMSAVYAVRHEVFVLNKVARNSLKSTRTTRLQLILPNLRAAASCWSSDVLYPLATYRTQVLPSPYV